MTSAIRTSVLGGLLLGAALTGAASAAAPEAAAPPGERLPDLSRAMEAKTLTISDRWSGLGRTYFFLARLTRIEGAGEYTGVALLRTQRGTSAREIKVEAGAVTALLAELGHRGAAPAPGPGGVSIGWTDDYPAAEVLIEDRPEGAPLRLFFSDQQRRWRLSRGEGSFFLADRPGEGDDPPDPGTGRKLPQARIHRALREILERAGLGAWIDADYRAPAGGQRRR